MTTKDALETLERIDDLFGAISNSLVYVCEELPSLGVTREMERKIVDQCCASLERLVEADKSLQRLARSLKGNVDRVPDSSVQLPDSAGRTIAAAAKEVSTTVQQMHDLGTDVRSLAQRDTTLSQLQVLLNQSSEALKKSLDVMRKECDALLGGKVYHGSPSEPG